MASKPRTEAAVSGVKDIDTAGAGEREREVRERSLPAQEGSLPEQDLGGKPPATVGHRVVEMVLELNVSENVLEMPVAIVHVAPL